jgi:hypothetical protein
VGRLDRSNLCAKARGLVVRKAARRTRRPHPEALFAHGTPDKNYPGIGSSPGPLIAAELGDPRGFEGRRFLHVILPYAGMDPRVRKSGQWSGKIKMGQRGSTALRTALYQAASMTPRLAEIYNRHKQQMNKHHVLAISHVRENSSASPMQSVYADNLTTARKYVLNPLDSR